MRLERRRLRSAAEVRALVSGSEPIAAPVARDRRRVREGGDAALRAVRGARSAVDAAAARAERRPRRRRSRVSTADVRAGAGAGDRQRARSRRGGPRRRARGRRCAQGQTVTLREVPGRSAPRSTCPADARPYPEHGRHGRRHRACGRASPRSSSARPPRGDAPVDPRRLRARRRRRGLPHGRRARDRRARVRHRDGRAGRRDRRPGQPVGAGGQAPGLGQRRDRRLRRAQRPARDRSTATTCRLAALDLRAQAEHGADSLVVAVSPDVALLDALAALLVDAPEQAPCALVHVADLDAALAFAEDFAPEHLELIGAGAEALAPRVTRAGCLFVGAGAATAFGDYVAGSNHVLPTDGAARFASGLSPAHVPPPHGGGADRRRRRPPRWHPRAPRSRAQRASRPTRSRWKHAFARMERHEPHAPRSTAPPARPTSASRSASTARARDSAARASASSTTCSTCWRATAASTSRWPPRATSRRARTTRSRTSASASGRRSTARSATAPASTATAAPTVPMDEARARVRDRHLGPRVPGASRPTCRPARSATSTTS